MQIKIHTIARTWTYCTRFCKSARKLQEIAEEYCAYVIGAHKNSHTRPQTCRRGCFSSVCRGGGRRSSSFARGMRGLWREIPTYGRRISGWMRWESFSACLWREMSVPVRNKVVRTCVVYVFFTCVCACACMQVCMHICKYVWIHVCIYT